MTNNKILYFIAASFLFWLGGSHPSPTKIIDSAILSGDIRLTLKGGVWKTWEGEQVYQDITLDLVCDANGCDREVWGFAPKFNQADHQGVLHGSQWGRLWNLDVQMQISPDPFTLKAKSGATMQGTFVTPSNVNLEFIPSETGGMIQATGGDRFIVVMTVQSVTAPEIEVLEAGFNPQIQVGNQTIDVREDTIVLKSLKEGAN